MIDANDAVFSQLLIWRDFNGDGIGTADELFTLEEMGIVSISLDAQFVDDWRGANWISHTATFTMSDGTVREIHDVWFDNSPLHSRWAWGRDVYRRAQARGGRDVARAGVRQLDRRP